MAILQSFYQLHNGIHMPKLGLGTYQLKNGDETYHAVLEALKAGYRHIDTAIIYQNEVSVGKAIKDSKVPRESIFITSKVPPHIKTYEGTLRFFERSLKQLDLEYIDLYIINAPNPYDQPDKNFDQENIEVYRALEKLYAEERVTAIGVSNFEVRDLELIIKHCEIVPHVNQIYFYLGNDQDELLHFCHAKGIMCQAYSPLGQGKILNDPEIVKMSEKYHVSSAQLALKYVIESGCAPIPKSSNKQRIIENSQLDFILSKEDYNRLKSIKKA
ncbi:MAG: aldo/keto reductase [Acholeplasmataceae bacterium]